MNAEKWLKTAERDLLSSTTNYYTPIAALIVVIRQQESRIAALEAARAPHGLPLEGTGPLPLERKGG